MQDNTTIMFKYILDDITWEIDNVRVAHFLCFL